MAELLTGYLQVFIDSQEAIEAGAQWRVKGTYTWHDSGDVVDFPAGTYIIEPKRVSGWMSEGTITVSVEANTTAIGTGYYFEQAMLLPGVLMLLLDDE